MNSRQKGARGEREWASYLTSLGCVARRGQQHRGGPDSPDVIHSLPGIHFEVKRVERFELEKSMAQAREDAPGGAIPVVATRRNRGEWIVCLEARHAIPALLALRGLWPPGDSG